MSLLSSFERTTRARACPVCGRHDWCLVGKIESDFAGCAVCPRVESPFRFGAAGYLHRPAGTRPRRRLLSRITLAFRHGGDERIARFAATATASMAPTSLAALGERLDLTTESLQRLGVGEVSPRLADEFDIAWAATAWTFPMRAADGVVAGIRLRLRDGSKCAVPGGREGLFVPAGISDGRDQLLICEGPTDTAAMLDLGFAAIGRPNCTGGKREIVEFVKRTNAGAVVVVSDRDDAGHRGAHDLARALVSRVPQVRVIDPPEGMKDARAWKCAGADRDNVEDCINATTPVRLSVRVSRRSR